MKRVCETAAILIAIIGWWGFVYPDLCLTEDTCEVCEEEDAPKEPVWEIGDVRIKSRVIEYVYEKRNENQVEKRCRYDP